MRYGSQSCHATAKIQVRPPLRTIMVDQAATPVDDDHKPKADVAMRATTTTTTAMDIAVKLLLVHRCGAMFCVVNGNGASKISDTVGMRFKRAIVQIF
jgi:hypothetical protein